MEAELWAARFTAAKRQQAIRSNIDRHMSLDDLKVDYEVRADFMCPFCYEDFDIATLCCHLDEHHSFEPNNAVCPVCSAKAGKDMVGHIALQHGHLFKAQRRRRFRKGSVASNSTQSLLAKELREGQLHSLFGGSFPRMGGNSSSEVSDPLLSSLVYISPKPGIEDQPKPAPSAEKCSSKDEHNSHNIASVEPSLTPEEREQKLEEDIRRTEFVQQLVLSTFLGEDV